MAERTHASKETAGSVRSEGARAIPARRTSAVLSDLASLHALGNLAVQQQYRRRAEAAGVAAKMRSGESSGTDSAAEREADAVAEASTDNVVAPPRDSGGAIEGPSGGSVAWPKSEGAPLDRETRDELQKRIGADFSETRVHVDEGSARFANAIGARAFTLGEHIAFAKGEYQPSTREGRKLIAHEAAHVVQQRGAGASFARKPAIDVTAATITPSLAKSLSDGDLAEDIASIQTYVKGLSPTSPEYEQARKNRDILQDEQVTRAVTGNGPNAGNLDQNVEARLGRFKAGVLTAAKNRLTNNQEALSQWRDLIATQFSAPDLQKQVLAQSALDLANTAQTNDRKDVYNQWAGEHNPYQREVDENVIRNKWSGCYFCHGSRAAKEAADRDPMKGFGTAYQSPSERMAAMSGLVAPGTRFMNPMRFLDNTDAQIVLLAIQRIRPIVAPLGDAGYRIIPDDVWSGESSATPEELRSRIYVSIEKRKAAYEELKTRIDEGKVEYYQLGPVLQSLLTIAPGDVQCAVRKDQEDRATEQAILVAGELIATLLSILIPPLAILNLAVAGVGFAQGYNQFQTGYSYGLGTGANDVFTREQQDQAGALMANGLITMAMSAGVGAASVKPAVQGLGTIADWSATQIIIRSDLQIARNIAQRALTGPVPEAELLALQEQGLVTRGAMKWTDFRGFKILYRGQGVPTEEILSPLAQGTEGVEASKNMYDALKAEGLSDAEIAGYTARWNNQPVPSFTAPPGMANQPLGGVGIPTTRLPGVASRFAQSETGVIYIMRIPKNLPIEVGMQGWGSMSAVEQEFVVFHQIPKGYVVRVLPASEVTPLVFVEPPPSLKLFTPGAP